ncbi:toxic anion resistance protein, partial [Escherichia coli]
DSLQEDKSIVGRIKKFFVNAQQKVGDQYKNSKEQIDEIMKTLQTGINRQHGECEWLDKAYNENKEYLFELRDTLVGLEEVTKTQDALLLEMQADKNVDSFAIQEQKMICEALSKQEDKIRRLIMMCELSGPRLMSMKKVNLNTVSKFEDLKSVVIPAWKSQLAEQLISERQRKDNELGNLIDNETNRLLETNSKMVAANMLDAAKANNRGIVDIKTLRNVHKTMIDSIEAVIEEEKKGKLERERAKQEIAQLSYELEDTLREIAEKANK